MKKQKRNNEDNRGEAIYARKSRIPNKGDSIGVQFKQCAEYAKRELRLDENYNFMEYEDKYVAITPRLVLVLTSESRTFFILCAYGLPINTDATEV